MNLTTYDKIDIRLSDDELFNEFNILWKNKRASNKLLGHTINAGRNLLFKYLVNRSNSDVVVYPYDYISDVCLNAVKRYNYDFNKNFILSGQIKNLGAYTTSIINRAVIYNIRGAKNKEYLFEDMTEFDFASYELMPDVDVDKELELPLAMLPVDYNTYLEFNYKFKMVKSRYPFKEEIDAMKLRVTPSVPYNVKVYLLGEQMFDLTLYASGEKRLSDYELLPII